jgi:hypothetical protein
MAARSQTSRCTRFIRWMSLGVCLCLAGLAQLAHGAGQYLTVEYPASTDANELQLAVTYTIWIPDAVQTIRGVIVHQHGAGRPASQEGLAFATDLHWQALAKKWDCILFSPSYHVTNDNTGDVPGGSQLWFDPRRGSAKTFLKALGEFAAKSGHPEIATAPWVLWGHSGGGIWSDVLSTMYPQRVVAIWLRSGSAAMWGSGPRFAPLQASDALYAIPIMANPGGQEKRPRGGPWNGTLATFMEHRAKGAPVGFAPDPLTGHWCGNSRYLAIPFFDACLAMRLPDKGSKDQKLKPVDMSQAWLAPLHGDTAMPAASFQGNINESVWLPNETVAKAWMDYVRTGRVSDTTPPPTPYNVKVVDRGERDGVEITWDADADFDSGILNFIILKDGQELGRLPAINQVRFKVLPMFQAGWMNSYGDAPANPAPAMRFVDPFPKDGQKYSYSIIEVNTAGLQSTPSAPVAAPVTVSGNRATPAAAGATQPAAVAGEIIIDNGDSGFHTEGNWAAATGGQDYRDDLVWTTGTTAADTPATATWTPEIKTAGMYDVYEWHGDDPNSDHAGNAPFTIKFDGGAKTVLVDLRTNTGRWNLLGTFRFAAGKTGSVTLSSKADGNVIADAVRFVPHQ